MSEAKRIRFTHDNVDYTLEYTRRTVGLMERQGFKVSSITETPMTALPALFAGAFLANHRFTKQKVIDEIFNEMPDKGELVSALSEMYNDPLEALLDEPEETSKNVVWEKDW